jgi:hypothetical protein
MALQEERLPGANSGYPAPGPGWESDADRLCRERVLIYLLLSKCDFFRRKPPEE